MILIQVNNNIKLFIKKCLKLNINLYNIKYIDDYIVCKCDEDVLNDLITKCYFSNIKVLKYYGKHGLINHLRKYLFDYLLLISLIISLFFISNIIIDVEIKHENKTLKNNIKKILEEKNIKTFTYQMDIKKLNKISDEIIKNSNNTIEWLSITRNGMKYIVSFEERIINEKIEENQYCNIIAKKDGVIKNIITYNGENVVERDKVVKKGDMLITGTIISGEEIKKNTCAKGNVYAEVWYKINITYPLEEEKMTKTNKKRINFKYHNNYFYKKHYNNYEEKNLFSLGPLSIIREYEVKSEKNILTKDEAIEKANLYVKEELLKKNSNNLGIIDEKVLKVNEFNSKIELEIFISIVEDIGETEYFEVRD